MVGELGTPGAQRANAKSGEMHLEAFVNGGVNTIKKAGVRFGVASPYRCADGGPCSASAAARARMHVVVGGCASGPPLPRLGG